MSDLVHAKIDFDKKSVKKPNAALTLKGPSKGSKLQHLIKKLHEFCKSYFIVVKVKITFWKGVPFGI